MIASAVVAILAALALPAAAWDSDEPFPKTDHFDAFVIHRSHPMVVARMDPIIQPGKVSAHVHEIMGASNFRNVLNTPQEQQEAECTSLLYQGDKSNYWFPALYYIRDDGKFEKIHAEGKLYYGARGMNVQPFPQGMRIVTGTAMSRTPDFRRNSGWNCQSQGRSGSEMMPNITSFPMGCEQPMVVLDFPSCGWANGSLDSWDHFSHMTFPIYLGSSLETHNTFGTICPPTHPIKYPHVRLEVMWYMRDHQTWHQDKPTIVLSNGDTTGWSFHADMVSGWDQDLLRQGIAQCSYGRGTGDGECEVLDTASSNQTMSTNCRYAGKIPSEDVGIHDPIEHLPGCNPLWTTDMPDDAKPMDCPWYKGDPGWTAPNVYYNPWNPGYILPVALPLPTDANMTSKESLLAYKGTWYKAENTGKLYDAEGYFGPWGEYTADGINWELFKWSNKVMVGTNEEVWANRDGCNATDADGSGAVAGMKDATPFTGVVPPCTVPPTLHQSNALNEPEGKPTPTLEPNTIQPACGVTATAGHQPIRDKYLPGPPVEIKEIANDPDPYSHDYSWYGSGYWPGKDAAAKGSDPDFPRWNRDKNEWEWSDKENFLAGNASPAPGFNGTLKFSAHPPAPAC